MTRQEQIEEISKGIHRVCTACSGEMFDEYTCDRCQAKLLIEKGYRKLPEDSVVLSREEICELKCQAEEDFNKAYELGSKETAEKIFKMLISKLDSNQFLSGKRIIMEVDVENLAKQFDVEI